MKESDRVDCLLNSSLPKCRTEPREGSSSGETTEKPAPELPEKLGTTQLRVGFSGVKAAAKLCGKTHPVETGSKVRVHVSIEGLSGRIKDAKAVGNFANTALGSCVAKEAVKARFDRFSSAVMGADFSVRM